MERNGSLVPRIAIPAALRQKRAVTSGLPHIFLVAVLLSASTVFAEKPPAKSAKVAVAEHMKEELGVNEFTTPGIELILQSLRDLHPVVYEDVARAVPRQPPSNRAQLALSTGGVIADGFLAVVAEKQSRLEAIGRSLLSHAKGLGVADYVTRHAKSILERAAKKEWDAVRSELIGTQRDVEKGMMALKDEEIAHLVALGGWWRGLEVASAIIAESYTPARARLLVQPAMISYFADRVQTLHPNLKKRALFVSIEKSLAEVRALAVNEQQTPPTQEAVKKIHAIAKAMNTEISSGEE